MIEEKNNAIAKNRTSPPLVECWTSAVYRAADLARKMQDADHENSDPKTCRREWFDLWGEAAEAYLRSPEFLQILKRHIDLLIAAKLAGDAGLRVTDSRSEPLVDDIQALSRNFRQFLESEKGSGLKSRLGGFRAAAASTTAPPLSPPASRERKSGHGRPLKWATASKVVYEESTLKLLHFSPDEVKFKEPILICFALVNRPYILDLKENRSVVKRLLDRGFDVYLIDWGVPDDSDSVLRIEDYVCLKLDKVIDFICQRSKTSQVSLLGYCMGGTMSTMFTALHPDRILNLILMAAPIDFDGNNGLLNLWARPETFDVDGLIEGFGNCPGEFLQLVFMLMKPVQNFAEKLFSYSENQDDAEFMEDFNTIERWSNDSIPVAGATFRQFVSMLYQENQLVHSKMHLAGERIRLEKITCPLLLLVAEKDHLVPPRSTLAIQGLVSSQDVTSLSISAGHIGLAVGSQAQRNLWPSAADWIATHSTER